MKDFKRSQNEGYGTPQTGYAVSRFLASVENPVFNLHQPATCTNANEINVLSGAGRPFSTCTLPAPTCTYLHPTPLHPTLKEMKMTDAKIELARLYENTSARSGKTYFVGFIGRAKVLMLKDEKAAEGQPSWVLFLAERPEKRTDAGQQAPSPAYASRRAEGPADARR